MVLSLSLRRMRRIVCGTEAFIDPVGETPDEKGVELAADRRHQQSEGYGATDGRAGDRTIS